MALYEKSKAKAIIADKQKLEEIVVRTIDDMAKIVGATLGPGGRCVLIERDGLSPLITKDGVTVAKSLGLDRAEANVIVEAAKEICINTAKEAGDGTTTAIVLADAITKCGNLFLKNNPKYNPQRLVTELKDAYDEVVLPFLKQTAIKVSSEEELVNVATISANGDHKIAKAVVQAVISAGDDGTVLIEEGQGDILKVEPIKGYIITSGLKEHGQIGPVFINDKANQQVKMDRAIVFLYDGSMNDLKVPAAIQAAVEGTELYGEPIIVVAHDFSDVVMDRFAKTVKGGITVVPIKTPLTGLPNGRSMFLHDLAAYTGAKVFDPGNLDEFISDELEETEAFGYVDNAKVNMYESFLTVVNPDADRINTRVTELKSIADVAFSDMDRMFIRASIGRLTGGVSTIWVGGATELEIREKKHRVEDAVEAVRSAIAEGVIPGGCIMHLKLASLLNKRAKEKQAVKILADALLYPFDLLMNNCGENAAEVLPRLMELCETDDEDMPLTVFDANKHEYVNALKAGIIEPAKVCRVSLGNALSVASLLITLGGIVVVPRDAGLENQLALADKAFKDMMNTGMAGAQ